MFPLYNLISAHSKMRYKTIHQNDKFLKSMLAELFPSGPYSKSISAILNMDFFSKEQFRLLCKDAFPMPVHGVKNTYHTNVSSEDLSNQTDL